MKKRTEDNKGIFAQSLNDLVNIALSMGALDAKLINVKDIVVRDWVRLKCQYGCGAYGKTLTCPHTAPPHSRRGRF